MRRMNGMKGARLGWRLGIALLAAAGGWGEARVAAPERPNIVFILGDDLGYDSLGCNGSELYKDATPRIDKLAAEGVRFTRCYATGICSPTRRQFASGQYPFRNGCLDIDGSGVNAKAGPSLPMLTQMLKDAGYTTGKTGKSDICPSDPDEELVGWQYWKKEPGKWKLRGPSKLSPDGYEYFPSAQLDFALDFIARNHPRAENGNKPFYFLFGFNNPHVPIERTPDTAPGVEDVGALYKDNIRFIDKVAGAIEDKLRETGCLENTILLVSGDNGSLGQDRGARLQSAVLDPKSGKYRKIDGGKADRTQNREGTALVPLVAQWPKGLAKARRGGVLEELVDFTDFLPTFADLAGAKIPEAWVLDGHSFAPLLRGDPAYKPREWIFHQIENNWCVRSPEYRLNRDGRFFDMADAPFAMKELPALAPEQQAARDKLQAVLDRFDPANGPTFEGHQDHEWRNPAWDWKFKHFGQQAWAKDVAGDAADPDGDGVNNIFERAFGWDPKKGGDVMPKPEAGADGTFRVALPRVEGNDTRVIVEATADGTAWTKVEPEGGGPFTAVAKPGGPKPAIRLRAERITPWNEP